MPQFPVIEDSWFVCRVVVPEAFMTLPRKLVHYFTSDLVTWITILRSIAEGEDSWDTVYAYLRMDMINPKFNEELQQMPIIYKISIVQKC